MIRIGEIENKVYLGRNNGWRAAEGGRKEEVTTTVEDEPANEQIELSHSAGIDASSMRTGANRNSIRAIDASGPFFKNVISISTN